MHIYTQSKQIGKRISFLCSYTEVHGLLWIKRHLYLLCKSSTVVFDTAEEYSHFPKLIENGLSSTREGLTEKQIMCE